MGLEFLPNFLYASKPLKGSKDSDDSLDSKKNYKQNLSQKMAGWRSGPVILG